MKKLLLTVPVLALTIGGAALASKPSANEQINLCHKTHSVTNPWVGQQVNANEVQSHLANGDKYYDGPLLANGHPNPQLAGAWCADTLGVPKPETAPPSAPHSETNTQSQSQEQLQGK